MRKLKFRAFTIPENEMTYSDEYIDNNCVLEGFFSAQDGNNIMQFTGLKDKNEKEIYEGDIINVLFGGDRNNSKYSHLNIIVYWNEEYLQWYVKGGNLFRENSLSQYYKGEYEVIGNIYENPELIK